MSKVLFLRSDWDLASMYLAQYTEKLVNEAIGMGHIVTDLYDAVPGAEANKENFLEKIPKNAIFIGASHGGKSIFTGQDSEIILDVNNADVASGKIVYLAACQTGLKLGPTLIDKTCRQFYGWQGDWVFVYNADFAEQDRPLEDPYAQPFFDALLVPGYGVLYGKSPKQIYDETIERHEYWWNYWKKQDDPMGDSILTWLNWNKENFIAIGGEEVYTQKPQFSLEKLILPAGVAAFLFLLTKIEDKSF